WDPIVYVDLHATDGAKFEHDISVQVEPLYSGDDALRPIGRRLRDGVVADLAAQGSLPVAFYPSFEEEDNPASGFVDGVSPPRFSTGYFPLRNRFAMLVETHSWKTYPVRVRITRNAVLSVLQRTAHAGAAWVAEARAADVRAGRLGGHDVPLDYTATDRTRPVAFRGYAYTRTPSAISGATMTRYDEDTPQVWTVPLRDEIVSGAQVTVPRGGYLVPSMLAATVAPKLALHGIGFRRLPRAYPALAVESFRADSVTFASSPSEGHQRAEMAGTWHADTRDLAAGALFVPIDQPRARLAIALLEPRAPDSIAAWGGFNNHFERKEYMEAYVAEEVARGMLAADPALRAAFEQRLRDDPAFAADAGARLEFFYRRHAAWDERYNLYPIHRTDRAPD
ncbi:MAG TPA: peptidase M14, partial [Luteimonas sp.]|nr:peptidase M14 [Luteimonas sp.]